MKNLNDFETFNISLYGFRYCYYSLKNTTEEYKNFYENLLRKKGKNFPNDISHIPGNLIIHNKDEIIESEIKNTQLNYDKIISKNIEKNQKNLNNPEEYFEGFFNDIIFNTKNNNLLNKVDIKKKKTFQ